MPRMIDPTTGLPIEVDPSMGFPTPPAPAQPGLLGRVSGAFGGPQGLLNLGANLMAAGGPSPHRTSFGQALGGSLLANQGFQQQQGENMLAQMLLQTKIAQAKRGAQQPSDVRSYEYAKENGYKGTFEDWKKVAAAQPQLANAIEVHKYYETLTPEQKKEFLATQRSPVLPQLAIVNGVPTLVDRTDASTAPLSTQESEIDAARKKASAESAARAGGEITGAREANAPTAYAAYQAAVKSLESAMTATPTGPVSGRIPAVTAAQQTAEGAEAAMAPILKQLFRTAGEGTFTDRDQELLMKMVPTRKDHPEARKAKVAMIDEIVRAKLGIGLGGAPSGTTKRVKVDAQGNVIGN